MQARQPVSLRHTPGMAHMYRVRCTARTTGFTWCSISFGVVNPQVTTEDGLLDVGVHGDVVPEPASVAHENILGRVDA